MINDTNNTNNTNNIDNKVILEGDYYIFKCPNCNEFTQVHKNELNCKIFRHAVYKRNFIPINPHSPKIICDRLLASDQIFGCAKPFRIINNNNDLYAEICDYI